MKKVIYFYALITFLLSITILYIDISIFSNLNTPDLDKTNSYFLILIGFILILTQSYFITSQEIQIRGQIINSAFNSAKSRSYVSKDYLHLVLSESIQYAKVIKNLIELIVMLFLTIILITYILIESTEFSTYKNYLYIIIIFTLLIFSFPKINPLLIASKLRYKFSKLLNNQIIDAYNLMMDYKYLGITFSFYKKTKDIFIKNSMIYGFQSICSSLPAKGSELIIFLLIVYAANTNDSNVSENLSVEILTSYGYLVLRLRTMGVQILNLSIRIANKKHTIKAFKKYISFKEKITISKNYLNIKNIKHNHGFFNLYGNSGSGKSTYIIHLFNKLNIKKNVSLTLQHPTINLDNFKENFNNYDRNKEKIQKLINQLGLSKKFNVCIPDSIDYLSGGEIKRVALIRQFILDSNIFIIDEPFSEIDNKNQRIVMQFLKKLSKSKIVIITGHKKIRGVNNIEITG